jgi:DNA-binding CsgD family transcriptional regulator
MIENNLNLMPYNTTRGSIAPLFFENIPVVSTPLSEDEDIFKIQAEILKQISTITNGSIYVIDFYKRSFHFVSDHDLFLSGFSPYDALNMGYDFFSKVVYPDDLQMFIHIHRIILQYLSAPDNNRQEIDYFAFNIRLFSHGLPLMVYHKMAPLFINGYARMAVCHLSSSVICKPGNLEIYYNDRKKCSLYVFNKQQWVQKELPCLTSREKDILKLSKQGKSRKEIANILCTSAHTIRNQEADIFRKLNQHSMIEAVIFATNHRMIFA